MVFNSYFFSLALPENLDQASISPQSSGVVYSKEYLSELKANTLSAPPPPANAQKNEPEMLLDVSEAEGAVIVNHEMASGTFACKVIGYSCQVPACLFREHRYTIGVIYISCKAEA